MGIESKENQKMSEFSYKEADTEIMWNILKNKNKKKSTEKLVFIFTDYGKWHGSKTSGRL